MAKSPFLAVQSCLVLIQGWIAKEPTGMEKDCISLHELIAAAFHLRAGPAAVAGAPFGWPYPPV